MIVIRVRNENQPMRSDRPSLISSTPLYWMGQNRVSSIPTQCSEVWLVLKLIQKVGLFSKYRCSQLISISSTKESLLATSCWLHPSFIPSMILISALFNQQTWSRRSHPRPLWKSTRSVSDPWTFSSSSHSQCNGSRTAVHRLLKARWVCMTGSP